jgi:enamine deaminase RidA (YjgF/YER057c/UK114 family)
MTEKRILVSSGVPFEAVVGYSRAVRVGNHVSVAGTTATDEKGEIIGVGDVYAQAKYILEKIDKALAGAGAEMRHVVRTRMFVTDISQWEAVGRAHGEVFRDIRPVATMVEVTRLIDPRHLLEIEVDAIVE